MWHNPEAQHWSLPRHILTLVVSMLASLCFLTIRTLSCFFPPCWLINFCTPLQKRQLHGFSPEDTAVLHRPDGHAAYWTLLRIKSLHLWGFVTLLRLFAGHWQTLQILFHTFRWIKEHWFSSEFPPGRYSSMTILMLKLIYLVKKKKKLVFVFNNDSNTDNLVTKCVNINASVNSCHRPIL